MAEVILVKLFLAVPIVILLILLRLLEEIDPNIFCFGFDVDRWFVPVVIVVQSTNLLPAFDDTLHAVSDSFLLRRW